jgi:REP element-mobilizing transposase RayT
MARGNRKATIFQDDEDRSRFLRIVESAVATYNLRIKAFCLMRNHYHFVLKTPESNLSDAMQFINGVFAQRSNRRHQQTGHVFEGRFRSLIIQQDSYLMRAARYVVRNPVRAGLVEDAASWNWSSYRATAGLEPAPDWLDTNWIQDAFASDLLVEAQRQYIHYVNSPAAGRHDLNVNAVVVGTKRFTKRVLNRCRAERECTHLEAPRTLSRPQLPDLFNGGVKSSARNRLIYTARVEHGYRIAEIARFLGIHRTTASKAAYRGQLATGELPSREAED